MDFFNQGIPLGRWFRIRVLIHWTFLLYAAQQLFSGGPVDRASLEFNVMWLVLLFGTVLTHEFGHALACRAVGGEALQIILWPLGGIAFVQPPMNPTAWLITTACGPLVNALFWPAFYLLYVHVLPSFFATHPTGMEPYISTACYLMWKINKGLLLFNLIPAYPMDGGRLLQEILWFIVGYRRSMLIAGMVGTVAGVGLVVLGTGIYPIRIPVVDYQLGNGQNMMLVIIGILASMQSFALYKRAQEIQGWRKN